MCRVSPLAHPQAGAIFSGVDKDLKVQVDLPRGPHAIGVTFIRKSPSLLETKRQPYNAHFNMHRHPRLGPAVYEVSITGPYPASDPQTAARHASATSKWAQVREGQTELEAATEQLRQWLRQAYRRPITAEDMTGPLAIYQREASAGHAIGIEHALAAILVSPQFLFKIDPSVVGRNKRSAVTAAAPNQPTTNNKSNTTTEANLALASRLSFFLWSSLPDEELLQLAEAGRLREPETLRSQVGRMLRDDKARSLTENFADQWLYLRNLDSVTPDLRLFPDFDDNLRQAFRQETRSSFARIVHQDRSVLELLDSNTLFVNERLARHYGIPHIYGSRFRAVPIAKVNEANSQQLLDISTNLAEQRGGLLRQGSILAVTSYATRTSPVLRGHWVLKNIVGSPPPPPPADVPALKDNTVDQQLSMRERLAQHRQHAACASCHNLLDRWALLSKTTMLWVVGARSKMVIRWMRLAQSWDQLSFGGCSDWSEHYWLIPNHLSPR